MIDAPMAGWVGVAFGWAYVFYRAWKQAGEVRE